MKEKVLIRYIRKSKNVMVPVSLEKLVSPLDPVPGEDMVNAITKLGGGTRVYRKEKVHYPRGVLVVVCRDKQLYFGWSYISDMAREGVPVGQGFSKVPSFVKKTAIKIAMDKINSRKKLWTKADMPIAVRKEIGNFVMRAVKYFKTDRFGNYAYEIEREIDGKSTNTHDG
jgi:hypothetical protein